MAPKKLTIAVNTRWLIPDKLAGIGWFTHHLVKRWVKNHPEVHFLFIFDREYDESFIYGPNITPYVAYPQARHPLLWMAWNEFSVRYFLSKHKPDIYFSPDGFVPLKTKIPTVPVIHDLNFEHHPEWIPKSAAKYLKKYTPEFAKKGDIVLTVSEFSKSDIQEQYQIPGKKIEVLYNGPQSSFSPMKTEEAVTFRKFMTDGFEYFLVLGSVNPRKNISRIFKSFNEFKKRTGLPHKLVVIGEMMYWPRQVENVYSKLEHKEDIAFMGRCAEDELSQWLASATALYFPSLFEGFGIPIIEAFSTDTPVITSNTTSMPEVAGDAALYVDPYNTEDMVNALTEVATKPEVRNELIKKGRIQRERYSWDVSAEKAWDILMKVIDGTDS
ncbi:MAG: hypothetical protein SchgKO_08010 [Schleiferiaceae bacterium]